MAEAEGPLAFPNLPGAQLCLDFANTADWHDSDHPHEGLAGYPDLVAWSLEARLLTDGEAESLLRGAERHPEEAASALERAVALREGLFRIFSASAEGSRPEESDLAALNALLSVALGQLRVIPKVGGFSWGWSGGEEALDRMLWPVARSAAELLTSGDLNRVRKCAGYPCGWLFLDTSRNQSRRWCDMKSCGNRAKARRHYERQRSRSTPPPG